jgi:hypothetical protein
MVKKILLPLFSIFLVYNTVKLLPFLIATSPGALSMPANVASAAVINLFITGVFAFVGFAYPTSKILPHS